MLKYLIWIPILILLVYMGGIFMLGIKASMDIYSQSFCQAIFKDKTMLLSCIGGLFVIGFFVYIGIQSTIGFTIKKRK